MACKRLIILVMLCVISIAAYSQERPRQEGTELWMGATLKMKVYKKLRLDVEQQLRLEDHESGFDQTFTEVGLRYKFF